MNWAEWWETQNWGSVPDWFAAVGTVGALLLGLFLIQHERRRSREDVADTFVTWYVGLITSTGHGNTYALQVHAHNAGAGPVPTAFIYSKPHDGVYILEQLKPEAHFAAIEPGETVMRQLQLADEPDLARIFVEFTDSRGRGWFRNLSDKRYYSKRAVERRMKSRKVFKSELGS